MGIINLSKMKIFLFLLEAALSLDCYHCSERYDHEGKPLGAYNDKNCYTATKPDDRFKTKCGSEYSKCSTELTAIWLSEGEHEYIFQRGCAFTEETDECDSKIDVSGNSWKKSCKTVCLADNCNDDIRVEAGFSRQEDGKEKVISCPTCSSNDFGGKKCGEQGGVESRLCPSFANSACFSAETEMKLRDKVLTLATQDVRLFNHKAC